MVLGAEYTVTTLVAFAVLAVVVGFVLGWLIRPWLLADRLHAEYERRLDELRQRHDGLVHDLETKTADHAAARAELDAVRADHARIQAELATVSSRAAELETQVATVATEKDGEIARLSAEAGKVAGLEVALAERDTQLGHREAELEGIRNELAARQARIGELESRVGDLENEVTAVRRDGDEVRAAHDGCAATLAERDAQLGHREAELAGLREALTGRDGRIAELEARLGALEVELIETRQDVEAAQQTQLQAAAEHAPWESPAETDVAEAAPPAYEAVAVASLPDRDTAALRVAEIAARTRGDEASVDDDLKRIRGIGPVIERLLKEMGITSFRQIARFEKDDIPYVAAALDAFPDRIERDGWMSSAARLHEEMYGTAP